MNWFGALGCLRGPSGSANVFRPIDQRHHRRWRRFSAYSMTDCTRWGRNEKWRHHLLRPLSRCSDGNGRSGSVVLNPSGLDRMRCSHLRNRLSPLSRVEGGRAVVPIAKRFRGRARTAAGRHPAAPDSRFGVIRIGVVSSSTKTPSRELRLGATEVATPSRYYRMRAPLYAQVERKERMRLQNGR